MSRYHLRRISHSIVFATTLEDLYNNHKINFDDTNIGAGKTRHTSLDWFMAPTERPSIEKAEVKENYIEIPGINGGLDLTESLTGFPLYNYIEGSFEFNILNDRKLPILNSNGEKIGEKEISWEVLNRDIRSFLNGKRRFMLLEDDPGWYYEGRFTVGKYDSSEPSNSKITISYKVYPYKRLSTCIECTEPLNSFFDSLSLAKDDLSELQISFWDKTNIDLTPGNSLLCDGRTRRELPCGDERVTIKIKVKRTSTVCRLMAQFTNPDGNIIEYIDTPVGTNEITLRRFVLTNTRYQGCLYSDDRLLISLSLPAEFDEDTEYKTGDYISYDNEGTTEILVALEDIASGSEFDISKWEVDETAMDPATISVKYDIGVM